MSISKFLRKWLNKSVEPDAAIDYKLLAESSNDVIFRCDEKVLTKYVSPSVFRLLGVTPEEMLGRNHMDFVLPEDLPAIEAVKARHAAGNEAGLATFRMMRADGEVVWVEGSGRTVKNEATQSVDYVIVMRDITERKALEAKLCELAMTDGLTGLANRRAFDQTLETEWRRAERAGTELSLLLLDLDHFKSFNDHFGHQVGDDCLRAVAAAIRKKSRRAGDLAARYGGEELAIILPKIDFDGAIRIGNSIRAAVEALGIRHVGNSDGGGLVTVSIGAATALSRAGASVQMPASLLQAADVALYKAKQNGRNRVEAALLLTSGGSVQMSAAA